MPSFIVFALWVGADSWVPPPETSIIREKLNESKGLLPIVVVPQVIERTDFFRQLPPRGNFCGTLFGACQPFFEREALALPIAGGAETAMLILDAALVAAYPVPDALDEGFAPDLMTVRPLFG